MGKYDNLSIPTNDTDKVKYYCLKMALEGKRTKEKDLKNKLEFQIKKKE
jgi:hypothetical protein